MSDPLETMFAWHQTVDDGRFRCFVTQEGDGYVGTLRVEVVATNETLLETAVPIAYAARFGPDVSDVEDWQARSIAAIDAWIARRDGGGGG